MSSIRRKIQPSNMLRLPLGLGPWQNDEGWGLATIMAPASAQDTSSSRPLTLSFGATPLALVNSSGSLLTISPRKPVYRLVRYL